MPITTSEQLAELKEQVHLAVADADLEKALALLTAALPAGRPKARTVSILSGRANDIFDYDTNNTLPAAQIGILRNELWQDLLLFTDHLLLTDFTAEPVGRPELKPGHLLYQVPPIMAVHESHKCRIRIAHQLNQVLKGLTVDESISLEEIPVAEVMEVEIIDPSPAGERAFDILLLSDGEQLVDEFTATEWVFNVRPLRAGDFELVLKISVLITVNGKERTKNIVLSRSISVEAEVKEVVTPALIRVLDPGMPMEVLEPEMEISPPKMSAPSLPSKTQAGGSGSIPPPAPISIPRNQVKRKRLSPYLNAAAAVLLLVAATFFFLPSGDHPTVNPGESNVDSRPPDKNTSEPYFTPLSRDTIVGTLGRKVVIFRSRNDQGVIITTRDTLQ